MNRFINADHFDERVRLAVGLEGANMTDDFKDGIQTTLQLLGTEPTADVVEVVHGQWLNHSTKSENSGQTYYSFRCSVCGDNHGIMWDFCPNCGADMRGGRNECE